MNIFKKIKKHFWQDDYIPFQYESFNPSKIIQDPQVKACINIKKMLILNGKQEIHPFSEDSHNIKICEFVRKVLFKSEGTITNTLYNMLDAFIYGFSISEIVYEKYDNYIGIKEFIPIDPDSVTFKMDAYGKISDILVNNVSYPPYKFIIYSYNGDFGNPYGKSDLLSVKKYYDTKIKLLDFYNIYLEKYVSPVIKGTYKKGFAPENQKALFDALKSIKQRTAILVPEECSIDNMNFNTGGGDSFQKAIDYNDRQIAKSILGQTIFTDDNVTVGSYSLANIHLELLCKCLNKIKRDLEESIVTEQIIKPLVKLNFQSDNYPIFTISEINADSLKKKSEAIKCLIEKNILSPDEYWIRQYLGLPEK